MRPLDKVSARFASFSLAGVANTLVGVAAITLAGLAGAGPLLANVIGYGIGLISSFLLNSRTTFKSSPAGRYRFLRFVFAFLIAFGANLAIVLIAVHVFGVPELIGNLAGWPVYFILFFLLCERWVFTRQPAGG